MYIKFDTDQWQNTRQRVTFFSGSPSPGRPEFESWTLNWGMTEKQQSCESRGERSAPLWVLVRLKRRVRAAHGRVARQKPNCHIYNRKEFIPEPFLAWSLARISLCWILNFLLFPKKQQKTREYRLFRGPGSPDDFFKFQIRNFTTHSISMEWKWNKGTIWK